MDALLEAEASAAEGDSEPKDESDMEEVAESEDSNSLPESQLAAYQDIFYSESELPDDASVDAAGNFSDDDQQPGDAVDEGPSAGGKSSSSSSDSSSSSPDASAGLGEAMGVAPAAAVLGPVGPGAVPRGPRAVGPTLEYLFPDGGALRFYDSKQDLVAHCADPSHGPACRLTGLFVQANDVARGGH